MVKKKMKLVITVIMAVCVTTTAAVLANSKKQKNVVAAAKPKSIKNISKVEKVKTEGNKVAEQPKNEVTTNNKQAVSSTTVTKTTETPNNTKTEVKAINTNYSQFFKKDVFIGDSITEGMSDYDFIDDANVCAKLGINLTEVDVQIAKAKQMQPQKIFLLLGANDIEYEGTTPAIFKERYRNVISKIKASIPNAKIYVQSILPVLPNATKNNALVNNTRIGQFNSAIEAMAGEENITYLNIASLINASNKNLYEPDGEHFKYNFYSLWLNYIEATSK